MREMSSKWEKVAAVWAGLCVFSILVLAAPGLLGDEPAFEHGYAVLALLVAMIAGVLITKAVVTWRAKGHL